MKPQDLLFYLILFILFFFRRGKYLWHAGMLSIALSFLLMLFFDNRFTMQRLTWYAAAFFLLALLRHLHLSHRQQK